MKTKKLICSLGILCLGVSLTSCNAGTDNQNQSNPNLVNLPADDHGLKYESLEHELLTSKLILTFFDSVGKSYPKPSSAIVKTVALSDGTNYGISFAQMVYLAGDYIADPELNISGSKDNLDNHYSLDTIRSNFLKNFNEFDANYQGSYTDAKVNKVADFLPKIQQIIDEQIEQNKNNIRDGLPITGLEDSDMKLNCATGGLCQSQVDLLKSQGLYMRVSSKGGDHFGRYALMNYLMAHRIALEKSATAKNNEDLLQAYAYEAYGDHYLTDMFASGHERTPIVELMNLSNEKELNLIFDNPILSSLLKNNGITQQYIFLSFAKFMHDQDNKNGLYINADTKNSQFPDWRAYGDKYLFINDNATNVTQAQKALQKGVDQIAAIYQKAQQVDQINSLLISMESSLPDLEYINSTTKNPAPMFSIINGYLYEHGFRDWSNGSSGSICSLKRNVGSIIQDPTILTPLQNILNGYCNNTIYGFAYISDNGSDMTVTSVENTVITTNIEGRKNVAVNTNLERGYITPILTASDGTRCEFKYPIQYKRYGSYTSLDEATGNSVLHDSPIVGSEYLNCSGGNQNKYSVIFKASALNADEYIGLTSTQLNSTNVKLCTDKQNISYLTNIRNECIDWK